MTYAETLEFLYGSLPVFQSEGASAYKPGLENTRAFNALLGYPDRKFHSVHIAGTNGKGSTAHMLAAIFQSAGYRTGLFTSPHLRDFRERIRVDGIMIPEERVVEFTERYKDEMVARGLTFFEMCTLLAFRHFADERVDVAIIETGLGGRLDATNIISPVLSVITNIGMEHTNLLGTTPQMIAAEKAGIIKPSVPVVIGAHDPDTDEVFRQKAAEMNSPILFAQDLYRIDRQEQRCDCQAFTITAVDHRPAIIELDLRGEYQRHNLFTVLAVCRILRDRFSLSDEAIREGLSRTKSLTGLRGRWHVLCRAPLTVCDTGHNAHGLREVVAQIGHQRYRKLYFVLGIVADKDLDAILPLLPKDAHYLFTRPSNPRGLPAETLAAAAAKHGLQGQVVPTVMEALATARALAHCEDMIFVGGSTFTVADVEEL